MAKNGNFSWNFQLFFKDCSHINVPNGVIWGSTSRPYIGGVVMSAIYDWGWPKNGSFWTKNGQTWQACQRSKVVQRGPKGTKMVNLSLFEHLGPFWAHLDPFGPFQTRIDILLWSTSAEPYFVHLGQKNHFCLKWSKRVQMDPKGFPNDQKDLGWPFWSLLGPFGPLWSVDKPAMFGHFWSKMDHFWAIPSHERWTLN